MVFEHVVECTIDAHGSTGIIHGCFCDRATGGFVHFVDSTHVEGFAPIGFSFLDEVTVAVVKELGGLPAHSHRNEAVFSVEGLGVGQSAFDARDHVSVGVVGVRFSCR